MSRLSRIVLATVVLGVASFSSLSASAAMACDQCCQPAPVCCCPPPPVEVELCVVDPCTGCTYVECICIPACCVGETPCMTWRKGLLGRKVLTYTWKCCDHSVDVVITRKGRTIVRD